MLRIAAVQLRASSDKAGTLARASALIDQAAQLGAHLGELHRYLRPHPHVLINHLPYPLPFCLAFYFLVHSVCLPEAWTGLYGVEHFRNNAEVLGSARSGSALMASAAQQHGIFVCGGVIEDASDGGGDRASSSENRLHNTIVAYGPDSMAPVATYRKMHLSKVQVGPDATSEGSILTAGTELGYFDIQGGGKPNHSRWRIGLCCCFDLRFGSLAAALGAGGLKSDVLLYPSAWLHSTGMLGHWDSLLKSRALDNQLYVVAPNQARDTGHADRTVLHGDTTIIDPLGQRIATCKDDREDEIVMAELHTDILQNARDRIPLAECAVDADQLELALQRAAPTGGK